MLNTQADKQADAGEGAQEEDIIAAELDDENSQADVEIEPLAISQSPIQPSAAEVEEHRITLFPFRRWCRECAMGRGFG